MLHLQVQMLLALVRDDRLQRGTCHIRMIAVYSCYIKQVLQMRYVRHTSLFGAKCAVCQYPCPLTARMRPELPYSTGPSDPVYVMCL